MKILGILNITEDSFSDGKEYLKPKKAKARCDEMVRSGAHILDISGQSSNPKAVQITPELEWERISPIIEFSKEKGYSISIDTYKPAVIEKSIRAGVEYLNDITAFSSPESLDVLQQYKDSLPKLILMHSHSGASIAEPNSSLHVSTIMDEISKFFEERLNVLDKIGIPREKVIIDPGMGYFLGDDPFLSVTVIQKVPILQKRFGAVLVSVSRKSFIGNLLGNLPPLKRGTGTLISELFLYKQGVDYLRTHDVLQLTQAIRMEQILNNQS